MRPRKGGSGARHPAQASSRLGVVSDNRCRLANEADPLVLQIRLGMEACRPPSDFLGLSLRRVVSDPPLQLASCLGQDAADQSLDVSKAEIDHSLSLARQIGGKRIVFAHD